MIYVVCHTHWDREWFAPSSVTNEWLKELFKRLFDLVEKNKEYTYVLDGQTLILEDLLSEAPEFERKVRNYVKSGNLIIGPFYAQIDFRISPESAIVKNLQIGEQDMSRFDAHTQAAWMVDNFGFISQLPQLLKRHGIEGAFLWRGVNFDKPVTEFFWKSSDGSQIRCIFLIGGYRNFYGIFSTKDLAEKRLQNESIKLTSFSLSGYLLLLDGYDLDTNPEDPTELLIEKIALSTPEDFLSKVFSKSVDFPLLKGEMISGKYACVFPGTLSTRVYLKRQAYIVGKLLRYLEFLSFLNGKRIDDLYRCYLKTLVHDNICGVGIDQVHKRM
ncbi:MAG: alpha-mannosidase, partial [Pseudothermotoga sp.]